MTVLEIVSIIWKSFVSNFNFEIKLIDGRLSYHFFGSDRIDWKKLESEKKEETKKREEEAKKEVKEEEKKQAEEEAKRKAEEEAEEQAWQDGKNPDLWEDDDEW